ncbi:MAG: hypothetical protein ACRD9R_14760 [Pyrinomonadaceae bacterium]
MRAAGDHLNVNLYAYESRVLFYCAPSLRSAFARTLVLACLLSAAAFAVCAQTSEASPHTALSPAPPMQTAGEALVVEGESAKDVFGLGRSVVVRGKVTHGVVAFGGDIIVEGRVEGDVATLGGSIIQREGSYIGGDVWVLGGVYHHKGKVAPGRREGSATVVYAGYEEELRGLAREPASLLTPSFTPASLGLRVLSILFWFIVSLALTAATPGAIGRAAARLQMTSLRVAIIGLVGACVMAFGVPALLRVLPPAVGALVFATAILLLLVSFLFGRVAIHAATGRWLQRRLLSEKHRSESVALLLGAAFWTIVLTLPYVWVLAVSSLGVISLGLALTARYRLTWKPVRGEG